MDRRRFLQTIAAGLGLTMGPGRLRAARPGSGASRDMHTDARHLEDGSVLQGDLCIVGAGAAGIALALEWAGKPHDVLLLEGGGFEVEPDMQALYRGRSVGRPYYPLEAARLRCFGGTTGHWMGFCSVLDPVDFRVRDWVPGSGWPIDGEELAPYYRRAQPLLELGPPQYRPAYWTSRDPRLETLPVDPEVLWTKIWQFSPPTRFRTAYADDVLSAPNLSLYTHAGVTRVVPAEGGRSVSELRVRTLNGREHVVRARRYVLACGALQNARLLLASGREGGAGLGEGGALAGTHFMEHLEVPVGHLLLERPRPLELYRLAMGRTRVRGHLAPTAAAQERERLLNGTAALRPGEPGDDAEGTFEALPPEEVERLTELLDRGGAGGRERARAGDGTGRAAPDPRRSYELMVRQEQAPNPASRVRLGDDTDALGVPRVELDWRLTDLDRGSMTRFCRVLDREVRRSGIGRVRTAEWLRAEGEGWAGSPSGAWHHMGTTRMAAEPGRGVVDADCRVHGFADLYVAGSSVFPTAGAANPTLTIVALALRLADHLEAEMS